MNFLDPHELHSPLWMKIEAKLKERLSILRARNDGDLNEIETARLRGRIDAVKELLALSETVAPADVADEL